MINRAGISSINKSSKNNRKSNPGSSTNSVIGRVTDIILNENHPDFSRLGEFNSIGTVFFEIVNSSNTGTTNYAKPAYPGFKSFPIIGELIFCFSAAVPLQHDALINKKEFFYTNILNLWNSPHLNSSPSPRVSQDSPLNTLSYSQIEAGLSRNPSVNETGIDTNLVSNPTQNSFVEKSNIHPLMPFLGDVIYEGRFGQSLRLGSTSPSTSQYENKWSSAGESGEPITILRNGQPKNVTDIGYIPILENINLDLSSIYLTSHQKLDGFRVASQENYSSYKKSPIPPSQYTEPQIALNSDRIVINAKNDHILMSSQKSIGMSTVGSVNIDAKEHYISSNDIRLGSIRASQPVLLGDDTIDIIRQLTEAVRDLASILQMDRDWPGGELKTSFNAVAGSVISQIENTNGILAQLTNNSLKSKTTKVQ